MKKHSAQTLPYVSELQKRTKNLSKNLPQAVKAGQLNLRHWAGQLDSHRLSSPARRTCAVSAGAVLVLGAAVMGTATASQDSVSLERTVAVAELAPAGEGAAPGEDASGENGQGSTAPVEAPAEPAPEPAVEGPAMPLDELRVTSPFGWRENPLLGNGALEWHTGIDFGAPLGTPVKSSAPGTVVYAEYHQYGGLRIVVDHGDGVQTTYNHLNDIFVEVGQEVGANEVIGAIGSTGNSTGPHLHFEVLLNGEYQDPAVWLGL